MRGRRLAPFIAIAVALVIAGLFVVLAGSKPSEDSAETNLMGKPAPTATGTLIDGSVVRPVPPQGRLGRPQLLPVELHPVPAGAPRAGEVRRRPAGAARRGPLLHDRVGRRPQRRRVVLRQGGRRLAGRARHQGLDRGGVRRVQGARDVDHRSRGQHPLPHHRRGQRRLPRQPARAAARGRRLVTSWNRTIKRWPTWVVLILVVAAFLAVGASRASGPSTPAERAEELEKRVACPTCSGESVYESRATASENIKDRIRLLVDEGELDRRPDHRPARGRLHGPRPARAQGVRLRRPRVGAAGRRARLRRSPGSA